ncbi:MAG: glycoside hydrolase family 3 C-terminal domain-containing protein, partial [Bacteroidota bacterium]|nr:glycoside hydrolase family 3 C-terminal domain-containing protein [Bacteroidota bacterium]
PYEYEEFIDNLMELVNEGKVTMDRIDEAVSKILKLKFELDLFENPSTSPSDYIDFASEEFQGMAYQSAAEAITLLKNNDNILPFERDKKILVVGPNADNMRCLNGAWTYSWQGELTDQFATNYQTIFEALKIEFGEDNVDMKEGVSYKDGGQYYEMIEKNIDDAVNASKESDVIVLCLGETSYTEKPGDINDITLHKLQLKLASQLASSGKPIVLVLNQGRPRLITAIEKYMSAIVNIYLPGNYGGVALADVLSGDVNPSGKLPFTYPAYTNSLSPYYYKPSEVQNNAQGAYNYVGEVNTLYDFGYGLSYSSFKYSDFTLSQDTITDRNGEISASFSVSNESNLDGFEVVQLYSSDKYASITPDIKRLRAFKRVFVPANSKVDVNLTFDVSDLSFYNIENASVLEQGEFQIHVGSSSSNVNTKSIFVE